MTKSDTPKEIAKQLFESHSVKEVAEIVEALQRLINLTTVHVYYCGAIYASGKNIIASWVEKRVSGEYQIEYHEDKSLIAGFKIVYKDYIYDSTVLNSFKNEIWKQQLTQKN